MSLSPTFTTPHVRTVHKDDTWQRKPFSHPKSTRPACRWQLPPVCLFGACARHMYTWTCTVGILTVLGVGGKGGGGERGGGEGRGEGQRWGRHGDTKGNRASQVWSGVLPPEQSLPSSNFLLCPLFPWLVPHLTIFFVPARIPPSSEPTAPPPTLPSPFARGLCVFFLPSHILSFCVFSSLFLFCSFVRRFPPFFPLSHLLLSVSGNALPWPSSPTLRSLFAISFSFVLHAMSRLLNTHMTCNAHTGVRCVSPHDLSIRSPHVRTTIHFCALLARSTTRGCALFRVGGVVGGRETGFFCFFFAFILFLIMPPPSSSPPLPPAPPSSPPRPPRQRAPSPAARRTWACTACT